MNNSIILILCSLLLLNCNYSFSQSEGLIEEKSRIIQRIDALEDSILTLKERLSSINEQITISNSSSSVDKDFYVITMKPTELKEEAHFLSDPIGSIPEGTKLEILNVDEYYIKVCLNNKCGWIHQNSLVDRDIIDKYRWHKENKYILQELKNQGFLITDIYVTNINSASGVSFKVKYWYNNKDKVLKYIQIGVLPFNAVGDEQSSNVGNHTAFTGEITGPIRAEMNPRYAEWDNAWYNSTIECLEIKALTLIYMDGSRYTYIKELSKVLYSKMTNDCEFE